MFAGAARWGGSFAAQLSAVTATLLDGGPFPLAADDPVKSMAVIDAVRAAAASAPAANP